METTFLHQHHYLKQLTAINTDEVSFKDKDDEVPAHLQSSFISLVCAMAWVLNTVPAVAVYVGALQRHLKDPRVRHLQAANRVLK